MSRWQRLQHTLQETLPENIYALWIAPLRCVEEQGERLRLAAPNSFFASWVEQHYLSSMEQALREFSGPGTGVEVVVDPEQAKAETKQKRPMHCEQLRLPAMPQHTVTLRSLHPRYTFDEFMVGQCNLLAKTASESLANGNTDLGRCLYIDGGTGLGKSHLSHAVAHHVINNYPQTRLHYLTARQLTVELVKALKDHSMEQFKSKYQQNCDMLLVDDVHTLNGRAKTQEELAAALDVLMETGKRVIFTGTMAPKDIPGLDSGMRSRLAASLITKLSPPEHETRLAIIRHKARCRYLELGDDLVAYMARHLKGDIRKIESAVVGLKAKSSLLGVVPDLDMVKEILAAIVTREPELTAAVIRKFLAAQFRVSEEDLQSKSRKKNIAFPRQVAMYLARKRTEQPLVDIGRAFNRDHSTVVHSIRKITEEIARNATVRGQVELLDKRLQEKYILDS